MKIVAYDSAKVTALFPFEEVAPLSPANIPDLIEQIGMRYNFSKLPDRGLARSEIEKIGIRFESGYIEANEIRRNIVDFTTFSDGMVISAQTTEDGIIFWNDISRWLQSAQGFRDFDTKPSLRYLSQIIVEFESKLESILKGYDKIYKLIGNVISNIYETDVPMKFARIDLEFDKTGNNSALIVPKFIIERRVLIGFERNRYMCSAPMQTADHLFVLENIERLSTK